MKTDFSLTRLGCDALYENGTEGNKYHMLLSPAFCRLTALQEAYTLISLGREDFLPQFMSNSRNLFGDIRQIYWVSISGNVGTLIWEEGS